MAEVNEEIAQAYFEEVCGYMVRTDYYFKKFKKRPGKKGGAGPADIDLLIYHPDPTSELHKKYVNRFGKKAIVSVSGWHMLPKGSRKKETALGTIDVACKLFSDPQASDVAKGFFGDDAFSKIVVISKLDEKFKDEQKKYAEERYGVNEVIEFKEILNELTEYAQKSGRTWFKESSILQTVFTLDRYGEKESS